MPVGNSKAPTAEGKALMGNEVSYWVVPDS
jgi:hypothetical protein